MLFYTIYLRYRDPIQPLSLHSKFSVYSALVCCALRLYLHLELYLLCSCSTWDSHNQRN